MISVHLGLCFNKLHILEIPTRLYEIPVESSFLLLNSIDITVVFEAKVLILSIMSFNLDYENYISQRQKIRTPQPDPLYFMFLREMKFSVFVP